MKFHFTKSGISCTWRECIVRFRVNFHSTPGKIHSWSLCTLLWEWISVFCFQSVNDGQVEATYYLIYGRRDEARNIKRTSSHPFSVSGVCRTDNIILHTPFVTDIANWLGCSYIITDIGKYFHQVDHLCNWPSCFLCLPLLEVFYKI